MVGFWVYDVTFLVLFTLFVVWFLKSRKKQLSREGIIFMYRTQVGIKAINWVGEHCKKFLHVIKYLIVVIGFVLMGVMSWMMWQTVSVYILNPEITKLIKAPPIAPLIPYFPKLFGMEGFFPPFYFTYFIVALAIVAIVHEFSHGVFMKLFGVKIKSTGLIFLGPILGAFVEEEKKGFYKKKKLEQMTILGAGVFANLVFALIFYGLYVLFFFTSFTASGYIFNTYGVSAVPLENITGFVAPNGHDPTDPGVGNLTKVMTDNGNYYLDEGLAIQLKNNDNDYLIAYHEAPAVKAGMKGAIIQANDVKIKNQDDLRLFLTTKNPGDVVTFVTENSDESTQEYELVLGESPEDSSVAYIGIGNKAIEPKGIIQRSFATLMSFKDPTIYYKTNSNGDFVYFIYHLLWWIMIINLLVALFNMLPLGILDGGRFFYLAVLSITKSKKIAKWAFKIATWLIALSFIFLMIFWLIRII